MSIGRHIHKMYLDTGNREVLCRLHPKVGGMEGIMCTCSALEPKPTAASTPGLLKILELKADVGSLPSP